MTDNQLVRDQDIQDFKDRIKKLYGVELHVFISGESDKVITLDDFLTCTYSAFIKHNKSFHFIKSMKDKCRLRRFVIYNQAMHYLARKEGHPYSRIGFKCNRNHATIIHSVKAVENSLFTNCMYMDKALKNIIKEIVTNVGITPKNIERKDNTKSSSDPIWDEARRFITK